MKRISALLVSLMVVFSMVLPVANATSVVEFADDRIIVKYKTPQVGTGGGTSVLSVVDGVKVKSAKIINPSVESGASKLKSIANSQAQDKLVMYELEEGQGISQAINEFKKLDGVEYAERDFKVYLSDTTTASIVGTNYQDLYGMNKISAPDAWELGATGSEDIVVGVLDTGIDFTHPDLADNIWVNPTPIYGDDLYGYDFVDMSGFKSGSKNNDDNGHGTHVAGTIGATGTVENGVKGVSQKVKLAAIKVFDIDGLGYTSDIIAGLNYANNMGIMITNNSYGGGAFSKAFRDTIADSGLFVAAAGNNYGNDNDRYPYYPAAYDCDNIIAVAATDRNDQMAVFSNYGRTSVDIAAPGVDIISTKMYGGYVSYSGTSMATPHVVGTAVITLPMLDDFDKLKDPAQRQTTLKPIMQELKARILDNADPLTHLRDKVATGARVNAYFAVDPTANPKVQNVIVTPNEVALDKEGYVILNAKVMPEEFDQTVLWTSSDTAIAEVDQNGFVVAKGTGKATIYATALRSDSEPGECEVVVSSKEAAAIPFDDNNFKLIVIEHLKAFDNDKYKNYSVSSKIYPADVARLTDLYASGQSIKSVKGIEYFIALQTLDISYNFVPALDATPLTKLAKLNVAGNGMNTLDIDGLAELYSLDCANNSLSALDVSASEKLLRLSAGQNQISTLDLSKNTALAELNVANNQLTDLDLSANSEISYLNCSFNKIGELTTSNLSNLFYLNCENNAIEELDVSDNAALQELNCSNNGISELDVSSNSKLYALFCSGNQLTTLDVSTNDAMQYLSCNENLLTELGFSLDSKWANGNGFLHCQYNYLDISDASALKTKLDALAATGTTVLYEPQNNPDEPIAPKTILLNPSAEVKVDELKTVAIKAVVEPAEASQAIIWSSSDETKATVDENGVVTGVAYGNVIITATSAVDETVSATVDVEVVPVGLLYIRLSDGSNIVVGDDGKFRVPLIVHGISDVIKYGGTVPEASNGLAGMTPKIFFENETDAENFEIDFSSTLLEVEDDDPIIPGEFFILSKKVESVFTSEDGVVGEFVLTPKEGVYKRGNYLLSIDCLEASFDDGAGRYTDVMKYQVRPLIDEPAKIFGKSLKAPVFEEGYPVDQFMIEGETFVAPLAWTDGGDGENTKPAAVSVALDSPSPMIDSDTVPGSYTIKFVADDLDAPGLRYEMEVNVTVDWRVKTPRLTGSTDGSRWLSIVNEDNDDASYRVVVERDTDGDDSWTEDFQITATPFSQKVAVAQRANRAHFRYRAYGTVVFNDKVYKSKMSNVVEVWRHNIAPTLELTGETENSYFFNQVYNELGVGARAFDAVTKEPLETARITKSFVEKTVGNSRRKIEEGKSVPSPILDPIEENRDFDSYDAFITNYTIQYTVTDDCGNTMIKNRTVAVRGELGDFKTTEAVGVPGKNFQRGLADYYTLRDWLKLYKDSATKTPWGFLDKQDIFRANLSGDAWDVNKLIDNVDRVTLEDLAILKSNVLEESDFGIKQLLANINQKRMSTFQETWEEVVAPQ